MTTVENPDTSHKPKTLINFLKPTEIADYEVPENFVLVGDNHIYPGSVFVIGGPPGVGKSRAAVALAIAGAIKADWFNLPVHRQFRTMILQNENGRLRLKGELGKLDCPLLNDWIRISAPPEKGIQFDDPGFQFELALSIDEFKPDIVLIDPWNACVRDDKQKDYLQTFSLIRKVIPPGDKSPALGIVAHTRKPRIEERANGRALLNTLSGSHALGAVPRAVFVMQSASNDPEDDQIVWTCCKNNDGELGHATAWERRNGLFAAVEGFNWSEFGDSGDREKIGEEDLAELFCHGSKQFSKSAAVKELIARTGACRAACYNALKLNGRFAPHLMEEKGLLSWVANASSPSSEILLDGTINVSV